MKDGFIMVCHNASVIQKSTCRIESVWLLCDNSSNVERVGYMKYGNSVLRCVNTSVCQQGAVLSGRAHHHTLSLSCSICCSIKAEYPTCRRIMR